MSDEKFTPDGHPRTNAVNAEVNATMDLDRDIQRLRARIASMQGELDAANRHVAILREQIQHMHTGGRICPRCGKSPSGWSAYSAYTQWYCPSGHIWRSDGGRPDGRTADG